MPVMPSLSALQAFEAAGRRLSFKEAAAELYRTPGAITRQVQALEESLGAPLFLRGHRSVTLTPAGAGYLADIAPALAAIRAAGERAAALAASPTVSVVAYPTFAVRWLIPRWSRFLDAHPDIDLRIATSLNPEDFARGDSDFAIRVVDARAIDPGRSWKLFDVDLFPVAAPDVAARLTRPADLAGETLLHAAPRPEDWPRWLAAAGESALTPARELRFDSLNLAIQAAMEGLGLVIGFPAVVEDDLAAGRLVRPFQEARRSSRAFYLAAMPDRPETPAMAAVRRWLLDEAGTGA